MKLESFLPLFMIIVLIFVISKKENYFQDKNYYQKKEICTILILKNLSWSFLSFPDVPINQY